MFHSERKSLKGCRMHVYQCLETVARTAGSLDWPGRPRGHAASLQTGALRHILRSRLLAMRITARPSGQGPFSDGKGSLYCSLVPGTLWLPICFSSLHRIGAQKISREEDWLARRCPPFLGHHIYAARASPRPPTRCWWMSSHWRWEMIPLSLPGGWALGQLSEGQGSAHRMLMRVRVGVDIKSHHLF